MSIQCFVAVAKHQQDLRAVKNLREQGYGAHLAKLFRHPTDDDFHKGPFGLRYPGYVFVLFDLSLDEHGPINNTRGLDSWNGSALLVNRDAVPLSLPKGYINSLRALEDEDFARAITRSKPEPRTDLFPGDEVLIDDKEHAAYGQRGVLLEIGKGIGKVLLGFMVWEISDVFLKKVEKQRKKAA